MGAILILNLTSVKFGQTSLQGKNQVQIYSIKTLLKTDKVFLGCASQLIWHFLALFLITIQILFDGWNSEKLTTKKKMAVIGSTLRQKSK